LQPLTRVAPPPPCPPPPPSLPSRRCPGLLYPVASVEQQNHSANKLMAFFRGIVARAKGIEYTREFGEGGLGLSIDGNMKVKKVIAGGQGEEQSVKVGSTITRIGGMKPVTGMELAAFLKVAKRPVKITFTMGAQRDPRQDACAEKLQAFFRAIVDRKKGILYSREFEVGPLGMEMEDLTITNIIEGGQAIRLGIATGSVVLKVGGMKVGNSFDFASALSSKPRPVNIEFTKVPYIPRHKEGMAWKLSGGKAGSKWKQKRLVTTDQVRCSCRRPCCRAACTAVAVPDRWSPLHSAVADAAAHSAARCSLLAARCSLLAARCSLLAARCSLLAARSLDAQPTANCQRDAPPGCPPPSLVGACSPNSAPLLFTPCSPRAPRAGLAGLVAAPPGWTVSFLRRLARGSRSWNAIPPARSPSTKTSCSPTPRWLRRRRPSAPSTRRRSSASTIPSR
jgi:hypothetical protein